MKHFLFKNTLKPPNCKTNVLSVCFFTDFKNIKNKLKRFTVKDVSKPLSKEKRKLSLLIPKERDYLSVFFLNFHLFLALNLKPTTTFIAFLNKLIKSLISSYFNNSNMSCYSVKRTDTPRFWGRMG